MLRISKRNRYWAAALLDAFLILLILTNAPVPARRLLSPLTSPLHISNTLTKEVFSFAPGLASNKFYAVDFNGMNYLAFYDTPINEDGTLYDGWGLASLNSANSASLFERAHQAGTKVVMTITADDDVIGKVISSQSSQDNLISSVADQVKSLNIDGVNIDFEYQGEPPEWYRSGFSQFVKRLTEKIHRSIPGSVVVVSIPSDSLNKPSLYDFSQLTYADKIFVIASDVAVPEEKNGQPAAPVFGFTPSDYWGGISSTINNFLSSTPSDKLVFERAWYGSGNSYPLYTPLATPTPGVQVTQIPVNLDQATIDRLVANVPDQARDAARANIPIIVKALKGEDILDSNVLAYALATVEHETDGTFQPIDEIMGRQSARRLGYEGGENYFGRGFIQLTHLRNYKIMGERIGMGDALVKNPDLASTPEVAAKILAAFFRDNNVANLASSGDFLDARAPINPDTNGYSIALLAYKYEL